jgi:lactate permease
MGVVFETLAAIVNLEPAYLASYSAFMLGVACLLCGLGAAAILKQLKYWPFILLLGISMSVVQYLLAVIGLIPLGALGAGLIGLLGGIWIGQILKKRNRDKETFSQMQNYDPLALKNAFASYGSLAVIMTLLSLIKPIRTILSGISWQAVFPQVITRSGLITPQSLSVNLQPFLHPGSIILLTALASYFFFQKQGLCSAQNLKNAASATWRSAFPVSIGVIAMVGLAALMDYCGMSMLLARGLSESLGAFFPLVSPSVGVLGAFATGSNNNSNVLFGPLQNNVAALLGMDARILLAAQTTGGALGSMIAPAKIIVGCSTVGIKGKDGDILRITLLYCLVFCLLIGLITWVISIL